jgi:hypothetical protein
MPQRRAGSTIRLDGDLSDPAWREAGVISEFVQREPMEGAAPTFRTEARVLFDDVAIYVGVRAFDGDSRSHSRVPDAAATPTPRPTGSAFLIDSSHDRRTAYEFMVNPAGVKRDRYYFKRQQRRRQLGRPCGTLAVMRDKDGWCAEFRIPYSQLRFGSTADTTLGIRHRAARLAARRKPPPGRSCRAGASGYVSSFGELSGVRAPRAASASSWRPTFSARSNRARAAGNPLLEDADPGGAVGLDMKYAVTKSLSFTGTVNPDFGQVEADPAEVNLSAFETFFNERRPFLRRGIRAPIVRLRRLLDLLFPPHRPPAARRADARRGLSASGQSTILGAGKLTGAWGVLGGTLAAVTQEEQRAAGVRRHPLARGGGAADASIRCRACGASSRISRRCGVILTSANRGRIDALSFLPDSAVTAAATTTGAWASAGT